MIANFPLNSEGVELDAGLHQCCSLAWLSATHSAFSPQKFTTGNFHSARKNQRKHRKINVKNHIKICIWTQRTIVNSVSSSILWPCFLPLLLLLWCDPGARPDVLTLPQFTATAALYHLTCNAWDDSLLWKIFAIHTRTLMDKEWHLALSF